MFLFLKFSEIPFFACIHHHVPRSIKLAAQQDCRVTEVGYDYRGDISVTAGGQPCKNGTLCRNSGDTPDKERPWCFTDSIADEWEYCDIPFCKRKVQ